jgi:hypothetical protein
MKPNPIMSRAHAAVAAAIRRGQMVRQPCEVCGRADHVHAHHDDYEKKLDVRWLCPPHHLAAHGMDKGNPNHPRRREAGDAA